MLCFRAGLWYRFSGTGFRRRFLDSRTCVIGVKQYLACCRRGEVNVAILQSCWHVTERIWLALWPSNAGL